jgi:hypothetical protein
MFDTHSLRFGTVLTLLSALFVLGVASAPPASAETYLQCLGSCGIGSNRDSAMCGDRIAK